MTVPDPSMAEQHEPTRYEIRLKGHLDEKWAGWFDGLTLTRVDSGETLLQGQVADQAALHGLLRRIRDLGLPLLSVLQVEPKQLNTLDVTTETDQHRPNEETNR